MEKKKEHDELDQDCWNVNSARGYFFNLYSQNIENCLRLVVMQ